MPRSKKKASSRGKSRTKARATRKKKPSPRGRTRRAVLAPQVTPAGQRLGRWVAGLTGRVWQAVATGWAGLSPARRQDVVGVFLLALAGVLFLALQVPTATVVLGTLHRWVGGALGWGVWYSLAVLVGLGVYLLLAARRAWPALGPGRRWGVALLWLTGLLALSALALAQDRAPQVGGGWVAGWLWWLLLRAFGPWGAWLWWTVFAVLGWVLVLDQPVVTLLAGPWQTLARAWARLWARLRPPRLRGKPRPKARVVAQPRPVPAPASQPDPTAPSPSPNQPQPKWVLPDPTQVLEPALSEEAEEAVDFERAAIIEETLAHFGAPVQVVDIQRGPTVTLFGVVPDYVETRSGRVIKVRVNKIVSLADDLALALAAKRIRIQAPVPGRGYIGIEVPNETPRLVPLRRVLESPAFRRLKSPLALALGEDVAGRAVAADLRAMPHLLIAGATGSGKSVALNGIIITLLLFNTPDTLRLILVDPKRVELTGYNGIPHLLAPVVVDMDQVGATLQWVLQEMDRRYQRLSQAGVRHVEAFHRRFGPAAMPYLVLVIDELADLMMLAPTETERAITRLAQLARATGIHLVIATQRPSVDVVTGLIKANFPARIAFAVASVVDSRVILDRPGAERLLGRGDMLFLPPDAPEPMRVQGAFVSDAEIRRVVQHWRAQAVAKPGRAAEVPTPEADAGREAPAGLRPEPQTDPLLEQAIQVVRSEGRASISLLQRRLRIGYSRAARLIDALEARGVVGPPEGSTGVRPVRAPQDRPGGTADGRG